MSQLEEDGFTLTLNEWCWLQPQLGERLNADLSNLLNKPDKSDLGEALVDHIYWEEGWKELLKSTRDPEGYFGVFKVYFAFFRNFPNSLTAITLGETYNDQKLQRAGDVFLRIFITPPEELLENAKAVEKFAQKHGRRDILDLYYPWLNNYNHFRNQTYPEWMAKYQNWLKERKSRAVKD